MFKKRRRKKLVSRSRRTSDSPRRVLLKQAGIGLGLLLILGLVGYGIWYGTRLPAFTIHTVNVVGGSTIPHSDVRALAEEALLGTYFKLVPKRFVWLYPAVAIKDAVHTIDRIKNIAIEREGVTLTVIFEEYQPVALWCPEADSRQCLFLDRAGYAFAQAPYLEGTAFLRYSDSRVSPELGKTLFEGQDLIATNEFTEQAYDVLGLNIIQVTRTAEDEIEYTIAGGGVIKVSTRLHHGETLENLEAILTSAEFVHLEPGSFKYIDLRFGNKVFVNEAVESLNGSSTPATTTAEQ